MRHKNKKEVNKREVKELLSRRNIDSLTTRRLNHAEHVLYNIIFFNDKPTNVIARLDNLDEWILNEPDFRFTVAEMLVCAYIHYNFGSPWSPASLADDRISNLNRLLENNASDGNKIKTKELMDILELNRDIFENYIREKFLPPAFDDEIQQKFWELIPDTGPV